MVDILVITLPEGLVLRELDGGQYVLNYDRFTVWLEVKRNGKCQFSGDDVSQSWLRALVWPFFGKIVALDDLQDYCQVLKVKWDAELNGSMTESAQRTHKILDVLTTPWGQYP